jgi:LysR family transcriptional regulator, flagellar master operon regulator
LARTFLEVVAGGSFVAAAARLNVTQSTVSMRVRALEDLLGRRLFERSKSGAELTAAGVRFQPFAISLMQLWEQARHHVAMPQGYGAALAIGGQYSLWDQLLLDLLAWIEKTAPHISIHAEYGLPDWLIQRLLQGILDIALMYTPQSRPGLKIEKLFEEELVLVTSDPAAKGKTTDRYILVDWGPEFRTRLAMQAPELANSGMVFDLGSLALRYILEHDGSGHFPRRVVNRHLESGSLFLVPELPLFSLPAYVVFAEKTDPELLEPALNGLYALAPKF